VAASSSPELPDDACQLNFQPLETSPLTLVQRDLPASDPELALPAQHTSGLAGMQCALQAPNFPFPALVKDFLSAAPQRPGTQVVGGECQAGAHTAGGEVRGPPAELLGAARFVERGLKVLCVPGMFPAKSGEDVEASELNNELVVDLVGAVDIIFTLHQDQLPKVKHPREVSSAHLACDLLGWPFHLPPDAKLNGGRLQTQAATVSKRVSDARRAASKRHSTDDTRATDILSAHYLGFKRPIEEPALLATSTSTCEEECEEVRQFWDDHRGMWLDYPSPGSSVDWSDQASFLADCDLDELIAEHGCARPMSEEELASEKAELKYSRMDEFRARRSRAASLAASVKLYKECLAAEFDRGYTACVEQFGKDRVFRHGRSSGYYSA